MYDRKINATLLSDDTLGFQRAQKEPFTTPSIFSVAFVYPCFYDWITDFKKLNP